MPELPEVETIRRYLDTTIVGKTITSVEVLNPNSFIGSGNDVNSQEIMETSRKGKVLNLHLQNGKYIAFHLKMSGQILLNKSQTKYTRVVLHFGNDYLLFNDIRKFGWVKVSDKAEGTNAPDVTRKEFTEDYFKIIVQKSGKPIKTLLMDQEKIAGIGNIYANDALFVAKILPSRIAKTLSETEILKLYEACKQIINEGIEYKGSSKTQVYMSPDGTKGSYQDHFKVYGQDGKPCKNCGTIIIREKQGGRSYFYCENCQK